MNQTKNSHSEHGGLLREQFNVENEKESNKNSSEELIHRKPLEGSAIYIYEQNKKWFAALGTKRLTEYYETEEGLIEHTNTWAFWLQVMGAIAEDIYTYRDKLK